MVCDGRLAAPAIAARTHGVASLYVVGGDGLSLYPDRGRDKSGSYPDRGRDRGLSCFHLGFCEK